MSRFQFVDDHRDTFGVKRLCRVVEVSRSGCYPWRAAGVRVERALSDIELTGKIREIHIEWDGTYGSPRITAELRAEGRRVNHKRVERVMREAGIVGVHLRKKVTTTVPAPDAARVIVNICGSAELAQAETGACPSSREAPLRPVDAGADACARIAA